MRRPRSPVAVVLTLGLVAVGLPSVPAHAQGGSTISSLGEMAGFLGSQIQAFQPSKSGGATSTEPFVRDETSTTTVGGRTVTRQSSYRIVMATDRDTLTFIIDRTERYAVPGATPEAAPFEVKDSGGVTLQVDTCPDEDGTITVTANASGTYDVVGERLAYHATLDTRDVAIATVGDDAELAGREHQLTVRGTATGDRPAFAGGAGAVDASLDATLSWAGADIGDAQVTITTADGVDARDLRASLFGGAATATLVDRAIDAAETVWQDGRCLELKVEPAGKRVDPGSETEITVTIEHKAYDEEVERDIEATLEGTEQLEPPDQPVMAPATFTYTATSESQGEGTITFRSVSNRGISEERSETYVVDQQLLLDAEGSTSYELGGLRYRTTYRGRGLKVVVVPGDTPTTPPRASIEGDVTLRGRVSGVLGRFNCRGSFRATARIDPADDVSAQILGEGDDRRLSVHLWTPDPDATIDFPMRCDFPTGVTRVPYSITMRDAWFIWSGLGTPVELPLTGGTASDRKTIGASRYEGSLTLRREESAPTG